MTVSASAFNALENSNALSNSVISRHQGTNAEECNHCEQIHGCKIANIYLVLQKGLGTHRARREGVVISTHTGLPVTNQVMLKLLTGNEWERVFDKNGHQRTSGTSSVAETDTKLKSHRKRSIDTRPS